MLLRLNYQKIRPKAKYIASLLFWPHLLAAMYCALNLGMHLGSVIAFGLDNFAFLANYLTLLFTFIGSLIYCLHIKSKASFSLTMLGCCQAAIVGGGLIWLDNKENVIGNVALILHGTSVFVLKYTLPFEVPGFFARKQ